MQLIALVAAKLKQNRNNDSNVKSYENPAILEITRSFFFGHVYVNKQFVIFIFKKNYIAFQKQSFHTYFE